MREKRATNETIQKFVVIVHTKERLLPSTCGTVVWHSSPFLEARCCFSGRVTLLVKFHVRETSREGYHVVRFRATVISTVGRGEDGRFCQRIVESPGRLCWRGRCVRCHQHCVHQKIQNMVSPRWLQPSCTDPTDGHHYTARERMRKQLVWRSGSGSDDSYGRPQRPGRHVKSSDAYHEVMLATK